MNIVSDEDIKKVLDKLTEKGEFNISNFVDTYNRTNITTGDKIRYEYISSYIKKLDGEVIDRLTENANRCFYESESIENDILMKIINHVLLEIPRAIQFKELEEQSKRYSKQYRRSREFERDISQKNKEFEEKFSIIQSEFISILSIFAAVIIGFFGGLNVIGSALSNMHNVSIYRLLSVIIILGIIMFNVIYMLLKEVSKLANKNQNTPMQFNSFKELIQCIMKIYPYAFLYNVISILGLILVYFEYLISRYSIVFLPILDITFPVVIFIFIVLYVIFLLLKYINEYKTDSKTDESRADTVTSETGE